MITWNYRVFREVDGDFVIREVFYTEDGSIIGCTANAVEPFGQSLEELATSIADLQSALALPVLTLADMPEPMMPRKQKAGERSVSSADVRTRLGLGPQATVKKEAS